MVAGIGITLNSGSWPPPARRSTAGCSSTSTVGPSLPDVYAAGDVANHAPPIFRRVGVEHWNNAYQQGRAAARAMRGGSQRYDYLHSFWSDRYEHVIE